MKLNRFPLIVALILLAIAVALGLWKFSPATADAPKYKLAKIERGALTASVTAAGTLNPVVSVQVGSQVSGQIKEILVDFNSPVKAGQLIARIDPETFEYRVRQAQADLDASKASLGVQQAEVLRAQANLADAQSDHDRKQSLFEKKFISSADRDKAVTTLNISKAALQVAESQARNSEAQVRQREAQVSQARIDLERTVIRAPMDGIVVKRSVEPGQTVAASLQAPELFVIAKNLTDMQVETSIDEADVGRIRNGQKVSFTVDAFPGRSFEGEVRQVRKSATVVSNVVTYTVVAGAANPDLILLPGMTANVKIVTAQKDAVLKAPNAALRFRPAGSADEKKAVRTSDASSPASSQSAHAGAGNRGNGGNNGKLWVVGDNGTPRAISVRLGLGDGSMTEIVSGEIKEGDEVITGMQANGSTAKTTSTPGPRMF